MGRCPRCKKSPLFKEENENVWICINPECFFWTNSEEIFEDSIIKVHKNIRFKKEEIEILSWAEFKEKYPHAPITDIYNELYKEKNKTYYSEECRFTVTLID